jgi:hypothetical protein
MRPRAHPGARWTAAGALVLVLVGSACGGPNYEYVRNTALRTAFKVPTRWTLFDKQTLLGLPPGPPPSTPDPIKWLVGIDGDPKPSVTHVLRPNTLGTDYPQGLAIVQEFSFDDRDQLSLKGLRDYLFPVTGLLQDPNSARVISYDDHVDRHGTHGVHVVFAFRASALQSASGADTTAPQGLQRALLGGSGAALLSPDFVAVNQLALVDPDTSRIYFIAVLCSAQCYDRNRSDIQSIVDSWTVLP